MILLWTAFAKTFPIRIYWKLFYYENALEWSYYKNSVEMISV